MAEMLPSAEPTPFPWERVRVPCPTCDYMALYRRTDGLGTVVCQWPDCGAEFDAMEPGVQDEHVPDGPPRSHHPVIYYMRMSGLVKIGTSTNIRSRFEAIGPQGILAVESGGHDVEHRRHQQFVDHHSHREWFHLAGEVVEHVAQLREAWLKETGQTVEQWLAEQGIRA
jgi:hypothetical protein